MSTNPSFATLIPTFTVLGCSNVGHVSDNPFITIKNAINELRLKPTRTVSSLDKHREEEAILRFDRELAAGLLNLDHSKCFIPGVTVANNRDSIDTEIVTHKISKM